MTAANAHQSVPSIVDAMNLKPDLIISAGSALVDALDMVTASHLAQQFLVLGAELGEPTDNVTAADWPGCPTPRPSPASAPAARSGPASPPSCTASPASSSGSSSQTVGVDNPAIADRLDAFAMLLELAEANPHQPRAYRRAAETLRAVPVPVEDLVRSGRVRELRGIGPGIEARLRELVETGEIAELRELEREIVPGLVGLGRFLGLTTRRSLDIARALDVRTPDEFRAAVAAGRLRDVPGVGPKIEARVGRRSNGTLSIGRGCCSTGRGRSSGAIADALAASRRAIRGAGGTRASGSPWSARPPIRRPCSSASRRSRRSWP